MHQWIDDKSAQQAGLSSITAVSFLWPNGILPRMRMLAAGFTKDGDKIKAATDSAWWGKPYAYPMWNPVGTYLDKCHAADLDGPFVWDEGVANAEPGALSQAIISIADEIDGLRKGKALGCAPFFIPARRGVMPTPNPACAAKDVARKIAEPIIEPIRRQKGALADAGTVLLFVLFILAASKRSR